MSHDDEGVLLFDSQICASLPNQGSIIFRTTEGGKECWWRLCSVFMPRSLNTVYWKTKSASTELQEHGGQEKIDIWNCKSRSIHQAHPKLFLCFSLFWVTQSRRLACCNRLNNPFHRLVECGLIHRSSLNRPLITISSRLVPLCGVGTCTHEVFPSLPIHTNVVNRSHIIFMNPIIAHWVILCPSLPATLCNDQTQKHLPSHPMKSETWYWTIIASIQLYKKKERKTL